LEGAGYASSLDQWLISSAGTATYDQAGLGGVANTATEILDNNATQNNFDLWNFNLRSAGDTTRWVFRVIMKKEVTATAVPAIRLGFDSTSGLGSGSYLLVQVETELGTLYEENNTSGTGTYTIQEYGQDTDFWEIVLDRPNHGVQYVQAAIYMDHANTYGGLPSDTPTGGCTIANAELYSRSTKTSVLGKAAQVNDLNTEAPGGYLIYDTFGYGTFSGTIIAGQRPDVSPSGSEVWVSPTTTPDDIYPYEGSGRLRTNNGTDLIIMHAGTSNTDVTVGLNFSRVGNGGRVGGIFCRLDSTGDNGYIVYLNNATTVSSPTVNIAKMTSGTIGSSLASTTCTDEGEEVLAFRLELDCDSAGVYGRAIIDSTTYNVQYLSTDLNTNEYVGMSLFSNSGLVYGLIKPPFDVADYP
jgi:hypothetical protein